MPLDPTELVTGEHSGIRTLPQMPSDNPALAPALDATGVAWIATDASREGEQRAIGRALTVPRHPMNIYYNTSTRANAVDEYNWIYTSAADGGAGICENSPTSTCITPLDPATGFEDHIVPQESRIALGHALAMDPRPHYAHQSNLTGDRILYPVLDRVLGDYRALFADSTPLLDPAHAQLGRELQRRAAWSAHAGTVTAALQGNRLVVTNTGATAVDVPVTTPAGSRLGTTPFGTGYAGATSDWVSVAPGGTVTITLAAAAGFRSPVPTAPPAPAPGTARPDTARPGAAAVPARPEHIPDTATATVPLPPINEATVAGVPDVDPDSIG